MDTDQPTMSSPLEHQRARMLAILVRELLAEEVPETLGDLTEALKRRCTRYGIGWSHDLISDAYRLVGSNTPLCRADYGRAPRVGRPSEVLPTGPVIGKAEAAALLRRLGVRLA